jgi:DUF4097 and DUF4098 domain-containing protein YvlB
MPVENAFRMRLAAVAILALAVTGVAQDHDGTFEQTLKVSGPVDMDVTTGSGDINVRTGSAGSVWVRGTIHVSRMVGAGSAAQKIQEITKNPPISQNGNRIRVGQSPDTNLFRNVSISYEVVVLSDTSLRSETGSGDQSIEGLKGQVTANSGSGNIRMTHLEGGARAETGSGDMELAFIAGTVYAETGSGNIQASRISGAIRAHAGSGDMKVEQSAKGPIDVETGSGNVEILGAAGGLHAVAGSGDITVAGAPGNDWKVDTGSGRVTLRLSPQAGFTLNAHTGSGSIDSKVAITMQGKATRNELRGVAGAGGPLVSVQTGSGDIRIE